MTPGAPTLRLALQVAGVAVTAWLVAGGAGASPSVATAIALSVALVAGVGGWFLWVAPGEASWRQLEDVARTGIGAVPGTDGPGRVRGAVAIRERNHAEALAGLRTERDAGWQALDTSPFAILLLDGEGVITWTNAALGRVLRLYHAPVGRRPLEVVSVVEVHEVVEETLRTGTSERNAITADRDLVLRGSRLPSGRIVVRIEDVTGAREAERARTDFVANVSHELRTPVASILGYLDLALSERARLPDDVVPLLETALRNGRRLRDLFEDLLKLHRIEARRRELPRVRTRLAPLLEEVVGSVRDKAAMRGQTVTLDVPPGLDVRVNPEALGQIVSNLVSNASAYSPEGRPIRVRAAAEDGGVRIDVVDQGVGIAERHHERIFERFYRVDEARSRTVGGTGLGLAIVKHYAKASGCRVSLVSKEGEGSTFTVHVPP